jgi:hypothetical protein
MAKKGVKKVSDEKVGDVLFQVLHQAFISFFEVLRDRTFDTFPDVMRASTKQLFMRYALLIVFCTAGALLVGVGISEVLVLIGAAKWLAYVIVGVAVALIGIIQFRS